MTPPRTNAVEIRDLFRVYPAPEGGVVALQGLTLAVRGGEVCVVLGPSGSGKTTLLRMLAGLDRPSAGTVTALGLDLAKLSGRGLGRYRSELLGYADQHYRRALAPELEARELVALQLALAGMPRRERLARAEELLEQVGLLERRRARPDELSGGEQQRIAVCAAVVHRPRLLLADEPTGELDAGNARAVYDLLGRLAREAGATTILVSHDPESVGIADRIVRVRDGRVSEEAALDAGGDDTIVVGRGGWLRLSEELLRRTGIRTRATARLHEDGIVVAPAAQEEGAVATSEARAPLPDARPGEVVATIRELGKTYGRGATSTRALADLDAAFAGGTLVAVTGPSGSGKTTLLHLLAGLEQPSTGRAEVLGQDLALLGRDARAVFRGAHVALVGQDPDLTPFLTAKENVELGLSIRRVEPDEAERRAVLALAAVGLEEQSGRALSELSSGQQERVAIARAAAARPALLLADEPTARLDQANALAVAQLLVGLARETGAAVVCATHDPLLIEHADEQLDLERPLRLPRVAAASAPPA